MACTLQWLCNATGPWITGPCRLGICFKSGFIHKSCTSQSLALCAGMFVLRFSTWGPEQSTKRLVQYTKRSLLLWLGLAIFFIQHSTSSLCKGRDLNIWEQWIPDLFLDYSCHFDLSNVAELNNGSGKKQENTLLIPRNMDSMTQSELFNTIIQIIYTQKCHSCPSKEIYIKMKVLEDDKKAKSWSKGTLWYRPWKLQYCKTLKLHKHCSTNLFDGPSVAWWKS